ncbi:MULTISPECIES: M56 family metallopeptidase [Flavobacterium]|uniref:Energy transducer TonB n=1 Tax=Flavobacterium jumunjinense TaxID=998845 RepID=A0ABV5GL29_9FLAO|nr:MULTISPECIES: M56 family metallopeptidase [Flavobacterium]
MSEFIQYSFLTIILQVGFLIIYQLVLKNETFFRWNRMYLLFCLIVSLLLPLLKVSLENPEQQLVVLNEVVVNSNLKVGMKEITNKSFFQGNLIAILYLIGVIVFFVYFIFKLMKIVKLLKTSMKENFNGLILFRLKDSSDAFSFLNYIFIGDQIKDFEIILKHELVHKEKKHSVDLLLLEVMKIIFWFNPLLHFYQKKITEVHDSEADEVTVSHNKTKHYQSIINQVFQIENIAFTNNFFNQSLIKKRIVMLQKSKKIRVLKYSLVMLLIVVFFMLFSIELVAQEKEKEAKENLPFEAVDEIPSFLTCESTPKNEIMSCFNEEMQTHIKKHFKYPNEAANKNIQGTIFIQFLIDKNGNIANLETRSKDENNDPNGLLAVEAKRIMSLLPKFKPAVHNGKNINVRYGMPLTFKLQAEAHTSKNDLVPPPPPPAPPKPVKK